uniref:Uncharacterized protein n=1 Tax=viral metagenome TaxID=1070528 RepID=A0A6C0AFR9_9ZZZZ
MQDNKILVIYNYYERRNYQKNQTNLSFFIRHGLKNKNLDCLFILNTFCEVLIPKENNFYILNDTSTSNWEAWNNGILYLENYFSQKIYEKYNYIFFMDCTVLGPLVNEDWLLPYFSKIQNSVICSNIITNLPETDLGGSGYKCSTYNFLLKIDEKIMGLLKSVFSKKNDELDAILSGEYALSRILLENNYNLSCLLFDDLNLSTKIHPDKYKSFNGKNLPLSVIFYKNIWKFNNLELCLPIEYTPCIALVNHYSNMIYPEFKNNINYNFLDCKDFGTTLHDPTCKWKNKEEFYKLHGYAEEIITFPNFLKNNDSVCIYHHYDSDNIIKDYVLQGLKCLILSGYDIYFCTSCSEIKNVDLPFEILYYKNYGGGTDFICYYEIIKKNIDLFKLKYKYLMFTNDSVIFPINGIKEFQRVLKQKRNEGDFWGHWCSKELELHLIGTLIEFKIKLINIFYNFLDSKIKDYETVPKNLRFYIDEIEIKILKKFCENGFKYSSVINYEKYNSTLNDSLFYPESFYKWLKDPDCFAIKWKYMCNYINLEQIDNKNLNYLVRYLHFGPHGPLGNFQKCTGMNPEDFHKKL